MNGADWQLGDVDLDADGVDQSRWNVLYGTICGLVK